MKYYILIPRKAVDIYKVIICNSLQDAFSTWKQYPGSTVVKDVKFKIVEEQ
jgi:hypothetical protein